MDIESYFDRNSNNWDHLTLKTPEQVIYETGHDITGVDFLNFRSLDDLEGMMVMDKEDQNEGRLLNTLIKSMLHLEPKQRIKPLEVLQHPFSTHNLQMCSNPGTGIVKMDNKQIPEIISSFRQQDQIKTTAGWIRP